MKTYLLPDVKLSENIAQKTNVRISHNGKIFISVLLIAIFEGAIRKWLSSSLTLPLVLIRDLLALYLIINAIRHGSLKGKGQSLKVLFYCSFFLVLWGLLQLMLGENNFPIFLFGVRFWLLYLWFGYFASLTLSEYDYQRTAYFLVVALIAMTPLVVLQHFSPPTSFINTQVDSEEGNVFLVIAGVVRTTGTFSFTLGYTIFLALVTPFVLSLLAAAKNTRKDKLILALSVSSLIICTLVSGSRSAIIYLLGMFAVYSLFAVVFVRGSQKVYVLFAVIAAVLAGLFISTVFEGALSATQERFSEASLQENIIERVLTIFLGESVALERFSWLGYGIGFGSNLAAFFQSGERMFMLTETETGRIIMEGGLLGFAYIFLKMAVIFYLARKAFRAARENKSICCVLMVVAFSLALLIWSAIGQLTANVFLGIMFGLTLLSIKYPKVSLLSLARP
ncbi:hypothetical protein [Pseudomonas sp. BN102]|uniref:O-antigen ligase family protein n=1 Tax=Pseudomonas sp. BN102 TaxID=2567886 RepID=UPI0024570EF3|nr:hypothetical protein [Pseudomonas sp. BN102]MDH4610295.1 hypothetical protein [Pseudomonas sp. BN102]